MTTTSSMTTTKWKNSFPQEALLQFETIPDEESVLLPYLNEAKENMTHLPDHSVTVGSEINAATEESMTKLAKETFESIGAKPAAKTGTSMVVRTISHPLNMVLTKNIFGGATLAAAWSETRANPLAGCGSMLMSTLVENLAIFTFKEIFAKEMTSRGLVGDQQKAEMYASLPAAVLGTIVSYPWSTKAFLKQLNAGKSVQAQEIEPKLGKLMNVARLYRGITPAILKNSASWSVGLSVGIYFDDISKEYLGDNVCGTLGAKTAGWVVGCFIGSPFFHMSQEMRKHGGVKGMSMLDVMKDKGLIYKPELYSPETCKVNNVVARLFLCMPLEQEVLKPEESTKIKIHQFVKNAPKLWKGFCRATPAVILTGISIVSGEILAQQFFTKDKA